uniref:Thiol:disulfide interchange protein n=1 Tax=Tolypiocladia glomerulata TaxID=860646 RepID=A0A1Z1MUM5_9FLOR|nr:thiol:disulfide interchange protein [Tolypiocladia glomerulata]ARW69666.1 thiol:disulfide interchange protein [Tolypiocladia glomerulata]
MTTLLDQFLDFYYKFFYYSQYFFSKLVLASNSTDDFNTILVFFLFGFTTVFTPCFISIIPIGLSYVSNQNSSLFNTIIFILGLLTSSFVMLLLTNIADLYILFSKLPLLSNIFLFLVALDLIKIINLSKLYSLFTLPVKISLNQSIYIQIYFTGLIIGFSVLPCNTSLFILLSFLIKNTNSIFSVLLYIFIYTLGFTLPLLLVFNLNLYNLNLHIFSRLYNFLYSFGSSLLVINSVSSLLKLLL